MKQRAWQPKARPSLRWRSGTEINCGADPNDVADGIRRLIAEELVAKFEPVETIDNQGTARAGGPFVGA